MPDPVVPPAERAPRIIAHRGSSEHLPEMTLKAYVRAIDEGADALECDVRLTADSHLVCVHDRRVDRTSNGRGPVSTLELAILQGLDFGSWKMTHGADPEMPAVDRERDMLLTLRHLIGTVLTCGREVGLAIETKHPTRYAGQVERELARVLGGGLPRGATIAGLDKAIIWRWPDVVRRQHDRGHQVYVWTVDEKADIARCLELKVERIISNRPGFVRAYVFGKD